MEKIQIDYELLSMECTPKRSQEQSMLAEVENAARNFAELMGRNLPSGVLTDQAFCKLRECIDSARHALSVESEMQLRAEFWEKENAETAAPPKNTGGTRYY